MRLAREESGRVDRERVAFDRAELAGVGVRQLGERGDAAGVALDRGHLRARREERAGEAAGAGADLQHLGAGEVARHRGDAGEELAVEEKVLPQRLAGGEAVTRDDLTQRRERSHPSLSARRSAASPAITIAAIVAPGFARLRPAMSKAVP